MHVLDNKAPVDAVSEEIGKYCANLPVERKAREQESNCHGEDIRQCQNYYQHFNECPFSDFPPF